MTRTWWPWARLLGGAAILAVLVWRLGAGPFLDGLRHGRPAGRSSAAPPSALRHHGVLRLAVAPGRRAASASGCRCGRRSPPTTARSSSTPRCPAGCSATCTAACATAATSATSGCGLRAVAWERSAGQVVQVVLAVVVLLAAAVAGAARDAVRSSPRSRSVRWLSLLLRRVGRATAGRARSRVVRTAGGRPPRRAARPPGLARRRARVGGGRRRPRRRPSWSPPRGRGVDASPAELLPLALLVLLAMARAAQHRRLGAARGRRRLGVRRGRARRAAGRRAPPWCTACWRWSPACPGRRGARRWLVPGSRASAASAAHRQPGGVAHG